MPLTPTAEVTPKYPLDRSYNSAASMWNHYVYLRSFGAWHDVWFDRRLTDQCSQDKTVFYLDPIVSPAPSSMPSPYYKYCVAHMGFLSNATEENQYLLIFHVVGHWGARAAIYINGNLVRSEEVAGDEYIAILLDSPPSQTWWHAYMFLERTGRLDLKGVQLFVL
jgi:hypothetical protein